MIDWKRVKELREEIGDNDFAAVADMFLEEADQTVAKLTLDLAAEEIEALLHFLKGSALNLGLSDLASICENGERMAAAGRGAQVDLSKVVTTYLASKAFFANGLEEGCANWGVLRFTGAG